MAVTWRKLIYEEALTKNETRTLKAKVIEKQAIGTGVWYTLANITSGPGEGVMLWMAIDPTQDGGHSPAPNGDVAWKHELRITVDGTIRVDTIVGNFFASTYGSPKWTTNHIGCSYMNITSTSGASSFYRFISIPFSSSLKVEIYNASTNNTNIWSTLEYYDGVGDYGTRRQHLRCAILEAQTVAGSASKTLIDVTPGSAGILEGFMLALDGSIAGWGFLEGNIEIWIDGTKEIEYSGTEDAFLGAFYWGQVKWQEDVAGMTKQHTRTDNTNYYQCCMYRFFLRDPIAFDTSIKIVWHNGYASSVELYSEVWYYIA